MHTGEYHVGNLLNSPVEHEESVELHLADGNAVTALLHNGEDELTVAIQGDVTVPDVCARCGKPVQLEMKLPGEPVPVEPVNGAVKLEELARDEIELARPTLSYCSDCQTIK